MPNYYNPYNLYPVSYANQMGYAQMPAQQIQQPMMAQQSFAAPQQDDMRWVEGELAAKMYQMPPNWPVNKILMLWDSTDTNIFLKSWGPMGIPNPIQKLHYTMETQQNEQRLLNGMAPGNSGNEVSGSPQPDMSNYVTKDEFNQIRAELQNVLNANGSQAGRSTTTSYASNTQNQMQTAGGNQNGSQATGGNGQNRGGNR